VEKKELPIPETKKRAQILAHTPNWQCPENFTQGNKGYNTKKTKEKKNKNQLVKSQDPSGDESPWAKSVRKVANAETLEAPRARQNESR